MRGWFPYFTTDVTGMFENCYNLKSVDLGSGFQNVVRMDAMFKNCKSLTTVRNLITEKEINSCRDMFKGCKKLQQINLSNLQINGDVEGMFGECSSLHQIRFGKKTKLTNFKNMIYTCPKLKTLNLSNVTIINNKNEKMIHNCSNLRKIKIDKLNENLVDHLFKANPNVTIILKDKYILTEKRNNTNSLGTIIRGEIDKHQSKTRKVIR